jgi:hypothetical protein
MDSSTPRSVPLRGAVRSTRVDIVLKPGEDVEHVANRIRGVLPAGTGESPGSASYRKGDAGRALPAAGVMVGILLGRF